MLVLVGIGYLRLPSSFPPDITVTSVHWTIEQGTIATGQGWFGGNEFNYTPATGWVPLTIPAGSSFPLAWSIVNFDKVNHTIYSVVVSSPFSLVRNPIPSAHDGRDRG